LSRCAADTFNRLHVIQHGRRDQQPKLRWQREEEKKEEEKET
jgi:hypothetical protein